MIARAFVGQDPFEVWGDGTQIRNWTYVDDIVSGTILAAEKINDGTAVNLGTMERIRVIDAAKMVLEFAGKKPKIRLRPDMPTGPANRVADNKLAKKLLDWEPKTRFREGLKKTMDWYFESKQEGGSARRPRQNADCALTGTPWLNYGDSRGPDRFRRGAAGLAVPHGADSPSRAARRNGRSSGAAQSSPQAHTATRRDRYLFGVCRCHAAHTARSDAAANDRDPQRRHASRDRGIPRRWRHFSIIR